MDNWVNKRHIEDRLEANVRFVMVPLTANMPASLPHIFAIRSSSAAVDSSSW